MVEAEVNHGIRGSRPLAQAFQILQIAPLRLCSGVDERLCPLLAAGQTQHLVARVNQLADQRRTNETCCACNKYTHLSLLALCTPGIDGPLSIRLKRRCSPNE